MSNQSNNSWLTKLVNRIIIFCQFTAGIGLFGLTLSRSQYEELSISLFGAGPLMGSALLDFLMQWPFSVVIAGMLIASTIKEFRAFPLKKKIFINSLLLFIFLFWAGIITYLFAHPILNSN